MPTRVLTQQVDFGLSITFLRSQTHTAPQTGTQLIGQMQSLVMAAPSSSLLVLALPLWSALRRMSPLALSLQALLQAQAFRLLVTSRPQLP
jgi:hypothetical protein